MCECICVQYLNVISRILKKINLPRVINLPKIRTMTKYNTIVPALEKKSEY